MQTSAQIRKWAVQACVNATGNACEIGQVGAGTGATVGKAPEFIPSDGGVGSAWRRLPSALVVGALVVGNAVGNIMDASAEFIAGAKD